MAIHYVSDFRWFSQGNVPKSRKDAIDHLAKHLEYVAKKSTYATNTDFKNLFMKAYEKMQKRKDARIALSFHVALPNESIKYKQYTAKELSKFISNQLNVDEKNIYVFLHEDRKNNFHAHIIIANETKEKKSLRLNKKELSEFHRKYDEFLKKMATTEIYKAKEYTNAFDDLNKYEIKKIQRWKSMENERKNIYENARQLKDAKISELRNFFNSMFFSDDVFFIVLINRKTNQTQWRKTNKYDFWKLHSWIRYMNANGYDVYYSVNAFEKDAQDRKKEYAKKKQRKIFIDIDHEKTGKTYNEVLNALIERGLPKPSITVKTSKNNAQAYWILHTDAEYERLKNIMKNIESEYALDRTHDESRIFRLPTFKSWKKNEWIEIDAEYSSFKWHDIDRFKMYEREQKADMQKHIPRSERERQERGSAISSASSAISSASSAGSGSAYDEKVSIYIDEIFKIASKYNLDVMNVIDARSLSEMDWIVVKELLKAGLEKDEIHSVMHELICRHRPEKLQRSPEYLEITIENAYQDLILNNEQFREKEMQKHAKDKENEYPHAPGI